MKTRSLWWNHDERNAVLLVVAWGLSMFFVTFGFVVAGVLR